MNDRQLTQQIIGRRIAEKARAPLATAARKALDKATAKLVKRYGGDSLMVEAYTEVGEQINGGQARTALELGQSVNLKLRRCIREGVDILDAGKYEVAGEVVVKLPVSESSR